MNREQSSLNKTEEIVSSTSKHMYKKRTSADKIKRFIKLVMIVYSSNNKYLFLF